MTKNHSINLMTNMIRKTPRGSQLWYHILPSGDVHVAMLTTKKMQVKSSWIDSNASNISHYGIKIKKNTQLLRLFLDIFNNFKLKLVLKQTFQTFIIASFKYY